MTDPTSAQARSHSASHKEGKMTRAAAPVTHPGGKRPLQPRRGIKRTFAQLHTGGPHSRGFGAVASLLLPFMQWGRRAVFFF